MQGPKNLKKIQSAPLSPDVMLSEVYTELISNVRITCPAGKPSHAGRFHAQKRMPRFGTGHYPEAIYVIKLRTPNEGMTLHASRANNERSTQF
jgi:hypothetical protein